MFADRGELRPGKKVLVLGVSGGVDRTAVQIADYTGAKVHTIASIDEKLECAEERGADHVINYEEGDFSEETQTLTDDRDVDMVADHIGEATCKRLPKSLVKGGHVVTCGTTAGPDPSTGLNYILWGQLSVIGPAVTTFGEADEVLDLVWDGTFEPRIREMPPMSETDRACELIEEWQDFDEVIVISDSEP